MDGVEFAKKFLDVTVEHPLSFLPSFSFNDFIAYAFLDIIID